MSEITRHFGAVVRHERVAKGVSQEELAQLAELDRSYMSRLEIGRNSPTLDTIERLARALQMLPSELIALADEFEADDDEDDELE